ncbi:MAG: MFS transporter [Streptococcaceae bacterium]|jgi:predicted MFS family arabinose efflux permease|nr:MFS transporter [Streptococcaceae bacterium]
MLTQHIPPLLRHNPTYRKLYIAQLVSSFGDNFYNVALVWYLMAHTHSALISGGIAVCNYLGAFLGSLWSNSFVDRHDTRHVLLATTLANISFMGLLVMLAATHNASIPIYYAVAFGVSLTCNFFNTARSKSVMEMVATEDLNEANNLDSFSGGLVVLFSSGAAGAAVTLLGIMPALIINLLSFMVMIALTDVSHWETRQVAQEEVPKNSFKESFRLIRKSPTIRTLFVLDWLFYLCLNASWAALPLKVAEIGDGFTYGLQGTLNGLGILLASLLFMRAIHKLPSKVERIYLFYLLAYALVEIILAFSSNGLMFLAVTFMLGLLTTPRTNYRQLMIQYNTETQHAGKMFSSFSTVQNATNMLMFIIGARLADLASPTLVMAGASAILVLLLILMGAKSGFLTGNVKIKQID